VAPAGGHAGGQGRWPPRLPFPASWGSVGLVNGSASYGRGRGGGGRCYLACSWPATGARRGRAEGRRPRDVGATGRGLRVAVKGSGAFIGAVRTS
jgi:hypothetical protein